VPRHLYPPLGICEKTDNRMISVMPDNLRSYAIALFCITQRVPEDALFACGS
jgi:hypothetical protein